MNIPKRADIWICPLLGIYLTIVWVRVRKVFLSEGCHAQCLGVLSIFLLPSPPFFGLIVQIFYSLVFSRTAHVSLPLFKFNFFHQKQTDPMLGQTRVIC